MDTQLVLNTLNQALSHVDSVRRQAEHSIHQLSHQPNYVFALATITTTQDEQIPLSLRQLAGVLLKSHVSAHWNDDQEKNLGDGDQQQHTKISISPQERQILRENLPKTLGHKSSKISTIVGMIIAEIAANDFPEQWPDLLTVLIQQFETANDEKMAYGSLKCLSLVAEHFSDRQVGILFPKLFPYAMTISQNTNFSINVRGKALSIASELIKLLGMMKMEFEQESLNMINPVLPETLKVILPIISQPVRSAEANCSLKMESLKIVSAISKYFAKAAANFVPQLLQAVISSLVSEYDVFVKSLVMSSTQVEKQYDSEGESIDFDSLVCQLLEVLCTLVSKNILKGFVSDKNNAANLLYLLIGYTQLTLEQQELFEDDPNQFVYDDEAFSIRISALSTIEELMRLNKNLVSAPLVQSLQKHMQESAKFFQESNAMWWKPREACFSVLELLSGFFSNNRQLFDIVGLLHSLISNDLSQSAPVYLKSRAIQISSKYVKVEPVELQNELLKIYVAHTNPSAPLPIRLYSTMSIARYLDLSTTSREALEQKNAIIQPFISDIVLGSCNLMKEASDDNVHIPLDALAAIIRFRPDCINHIGSNVISLLLDLCARCASDPTVPMDIINVFEQMAKSRPNYETLKDTLAPQIARILTSTAVTTQQTLVQILIDILTVIMTYAAPQDVPLLLSSCFVPIANIVLDNDDPHLLSNATECLRAYVYISGEQLLTHQYTVTENNETRQKAPIHFIFQIIAKLLGPDLPDRAVYGVGGLMTALFAVLGNQLNSDVTATIIKASINRLAMAEELTVIQSIIIALAKMVHDHMESLVGLLSSYNLKTKDNNSLNALLLFLQKWSDNQSHFFGRFRLKVSILALVKMLMSGDQRLALNIQIDSPDTDSGYKTRSSGTLKKQTILFPIQAFLLIVEGYFRAKEAREFEEKGDLDELLYGADDDDDDFDYDEDEDGGEEDGDAPAFADADDMNYLKHLVSNEHLDDLDEDDIEDKFEKQDPINKVDLEQVLPGYIREIVAKYPQLLPAAQPFMNDKHKKFVQQILSASN